MIHTNKSYVLLISEISIFMLNQMPDESCRKCGGGLTSYSKCAKCNEINKMICKQCGEKTSEQFHALCMYYVESHSLNEPDFNPRLISIISTI
jgi:predicted amidophosphoribosyltransferase